MDPIQLQSQNIADRDPGILDPNGFVLPPGDVEDLWLHDRIHLETLKTSADFVQVLQDATLDDPTLGIVKKQTLATYTSPAMLFLFFLFFYYMMNWVLHDLQLGKGWLEGVAQTPIVGCL